MIPFYFFFVKYLKKENDPLFNSLSETVCKQFFWEKQPGGWAAFG